MLMAWASRPESIWKLAAAGRAISAARQGAGVQGRAGAGEAAAGRLMPMAPYAQDVRRLRQRSRICANGRPTACCAARACSTAPATCRSAPRRSWPAARSIGSSRARSGCASASRARSRYGRRGRRPLLRHPSGVGTGARHPQAGAPDAGLALSDGRRRPDRPRPESQGRDRGDAGRHGEGAEGAGADVETEAVHHRSHIGSPSRASYSASGRLVSVITLGRSVTAVMTGVYSLNLSSKCFASLIIS
jgi:hypothetical protein